MNNQVSGQVNPATLAPSLFPYTFPASGEGTVVITQEQKEDSSQTTIQYLKPKPPKPPKAPKKPSIFAPAFQWTYLAINSLALKALYHLEPTTFTVSATAGALYQVASAPKKQMIINQTAEQFTKANALKKTALLATLVLGTVAACRFPGEKYLLHEKSGASFATGLVIYSAYQLGRELSSLTATYLPSLPKSFTFKRGE